MRAIIAALLIASPAAAQSIRDNAPSNWAIDHGDCATVLEIVDDPIAAIDRGDAAVIEIVGAFEAYMSGAADMLFVNDEQGRSRMKTAIFALCDQAPDATVSSIVAAIAAAQ